MDTSPFKKKSVIIIRENAPSFLHWYGTSFPSQAYAPSETLPMLLARSWRATFRSVFPAGRVPSLKLNPSYCRVVEVRKLRSVVELKLQSSPPRYCITAGLCTVLLSYRMLKHMETVSFLCPSLLNI